MYVRRHHRTGDGLPVGPGEVLRSFLAELDGEGIDYAQLHDPDDLTTRPGSDVDFVVRPDALRQVERLAAKVAREHGWLVTQRLRHELWSAQVTMVDPDSPRAALALDACAQFSLSGCRFLSADRLLTERVRASDGTWVAAPAAEFGYLMAKSLSKQQPERIRPRLRELHRKDPSGTQAMARRLCGDSAAVVEGWLHAEEVDWAAMRAALIAAHRFGPLERIRDAGRRVARATRPTGLVVSVLGPDGSGKTTLVQALGAQLSSTFFAAPLVFKFRPDVTGRIVPGIDPTPHAREPRNRPVSVLKIAFYAADWWVGWWRLLRPAERRGSLVIFDRDFSDLVVDERRYLVRGVSGLAAVCRRLVPRPAASYVLDAEPAEVHARKPELGIAELTRQRAAYRRLSDRDRRIELVDATLPASEVSAGVVTDLVLHLAMRERRRARAPLSRTRDVVVAGISLAVLAPVAATVAVAVRIRLGTPVVFRQERPGLLGQPFTLLKFRTMTEDRDPSTGRHRPDADRMTPLGRWLRRTSLDELPSLVNVVRGEMSLVGPRPLLTRYLPRYSAAELRRHDVLPGLTGWAQVNGRNAAGWEEKFALDLWYVDHHSHSTDLRVLWRTFAVVLGGQGVSQPGHVTGEEFWGGHARVSPASEVSGNDAAGT